MKLLIIGGSRFLGRHLVAAALRSHHEVTLFNRGNHPTEDRGSVETIHGDRRHDLNKLADRRWGAVIDTCGYLPRTVTASAQALSDLVEAYVFISSQSVYRDLSLPGVAENAPLATITTEQLEEANALDSRGEVSALTTGKMYGGLKALCEQAVEETIPDRVLTIRPGLLVGPYDYTDRFTYWVVRVAEGGEVLSPGRPDKHVQFVDARDVADWTVGMIEKKETGIYNCNGSPGELTMAELLERCKKVSGSDAKFTWVDEGFLLKENVAAWSEMPLWLPEDVAPHLKGFMYVSSEKAVRMGLTYRQLSATVGDTLAWTQGTRPAALLKAGIERDKEKTLLAEFHRQSAT